MFCHTETESLPKSQRGFKDWRLLVEEITVTPTVPSSSGNSTISAKIRNVGETAVFNAIAELYDGVILPPLLSPRYPRYQSFLPIWQNVAVATVHNLTHPSYMTGRQQLRWLRPA